MVAAAAEVVNGPAEPAPGGRDRGAAESDMVGGGPRRSSEGAVRTLPRCLTFIVVLVVGCRPEVAPDATTTADPPDRTDPGGPVVTVWANYPGANAQTTSDVVVAPLMHTINGAE